MGNLNCFKPDNQNKKSRWFEEWHNNSFFQNPYNHYERNYSNKLGENMFSTNEEVMKNYYSNHQSLNYSDFPSNILETSQYNEDDYKIQMENCYTNDVYGIRDDGMMDNINRNGMSNKSLQENVQEAFMSDWFVREEAELNCNMQTLQNSDFNSQYEDKFVDDEMKRNKVQAKKELSKEVEPLENSSDSDMCSIDCLVKTESKGGASMGFTTKKNAKCCYTAYIMCNNSVEWDNFLKRSARMMTGLQRQFSCIIKFSDKISFHRGNSVRTFQIIGRHKGNVIRCKAALPKMVSKMLITSMTCSAEVEEYSKECNRESRPNVNRKMKCLN